MTLVKAMKDALDGGYALAAFNAPGFDAMRAISQAAADVARPVIIQTSAKLVKQHGASAVAAWFSSAQETTGAQSYLHLDHCMDIDLIGDCIDAGWDMVMFDGSHMSLDQNITKSKQICDMAHAKDVAVEGEVGCIGGEEDGIEAEANYASEADIHRLSLDTGIDCIAVGFGNVHGDYDTKANLRWDIYEGAAAIAKLPLVLHGGSGLSDAEFERAIAAGTAKVNISTELKKAYFAAVQDEAMLAKLLSSPGALHDAIFAACYQVAKTYILKFNSSQERRV